MILIFSIMYKSWSCKNKREKKTTTRDIWFKQIIWRIDAVYNWACYDNDRPTLKRLENNLSSLATFSKTTVVITSSKKKSNVCATSCPSKATFSCLRSNSHRWPLVTVMLHDTPLIHNLNQHISMTLHTAPLMCKPNHHVISHCQCYTQ